MLDWLDAQGLLSGPPAAINTIPCPWSYRHAERPLATYQSRPERRFLCDRCRPTFLEFANWVASQGGPGVPISGTVDHLLATWGYQPETRYCWHLERLFQLSWGHFSRAYAGPVVVAGFPKPQRTTEAEAWLHAPNRVTITKVINDPRRGPGLVGDTFNQYRQRLTRGW